MIKILPNLRFSYNFSRGAVADRFKHSDDFNKQIFDRIIQLYDKKTLCGIGVIKNSYNKFLPENKNIEIVPMQVRDYDEYGGGTRVEAIGDTLIGYSIEVPVNVKRKLNILELPEFMHESTHVLDYLFNPKYIMNYCKMCEKRIFDKDYFKIYDKYFYNTDGMRENNKKEILKIAEIETRKALESVPFEEKTIFLNYIKYSMQMEKHAYEQGIEFAEYLTKLGKPVDNESLDDYNKYLYFDEKIKMINDMLKEEIEIQRIENLKK